MSLEIQVDKKKIAKIVGIIIAVFALAIVGMNSFTLVEAGRIKIKRKSKSIEPVMCSDCLTSGRCDKHKNSNVEMSVFIKILLAIGIVKVKKSE